MKVIIARGLPGSGKSTWLDRNYPDAVVCSADFYHMVEGEYRFDPRNAGKAHADCLRSYLKALELLTVQAPQTVVAVDNTNTTAHEISPYLRLAEVFDCDYEIAWIDVPLKICLQRQTHNVPLQTMLRMAHNLMQPLPDNWKMRMVFDGEQK